MEHYYLPARALGIVARRRQTIADDIIDLTAKLPWWLGLLLAVISYVVLHRIAGQGLPQASGQDVFAPASWIHALLCRKSRWNNSVGVKAKEA